MAVEEEALGLWGASVVEGKGEEAASQLTFARALGRALEEATGDAMAADSVTRIDRAAQNGPPADLARLAAGHAAFGQGSTRSPTTC